MHHPLHRLSSVSRVRVAGHKDLFPLHPVTLWGCFLGGKCGIVVETHLRRRGIYVGNGTVQERIKCVSRGRSDTPVVTFLSG